VAAARLPPRFEEATLTTLIRVVVAIVAAALLATGAAAAGSPNKAKTLVLQKSDFPPGTAIGTSGGSASAAGSGWGVTFRYKTNGKPNELSASVAAVKSKSLAVQMFRDLKSEMGPAIPKLTLPRYGDEQAANFSVLGGSQLIVRKGSVVWVLELQTFLTRGGQTHELTKGEAIAEYKRYAPKQQRRVGNG
jgi:hypothetical protein